MKFATIAVAALSATTTQAVAVAYAEANPSPEAWCLFKGQGCWKVRRAADAFADAITSSGGIKRSPAADVSNYVGGAAYNAKRGVEDLASIIAATSDSPEEYYIRLGLASQFHADSNMTEAEAEADVDGADVDPTDIARRTESESEEDKRWCLFKGQGCWKREAAPWCLFKGQGCWKRAVPLSAREAEANPWCLFKGQGCWKRADGDAAAGVDKREAAPAFCPFGGEAGATCYASKRDFVGADKRSCEQPGEACHKARRAAEALIGAVETEEVAKRDVEVDARWCLFKGQGCWKRDGVDEVVARCNAPGGACTKASRDLAAMTHAARSLLESLDEQ